MGFTTITMVGLLILVSSCAQQQDSQTSSSAQSSVSKFSDSSAANCQNDGKIEGTQESCKGVDGKDGLGLAPLIGVGVLIMVLVDVAMDPRDVYAPEPFRYTCLDVKTAIKECLALRERFGRGPRGPYCEFPSPECERAKTYCSNDHYESLLKEAEKICVRKADVRPSVE